MLLAERKKAAITLSPVFALVSKNIISFSWANRLASSIVTSHDANSGAYFEKMDQIHAYMVIRRFPKQLRRKVHRHFKKFFSERTLVGQPWIMDDKSSVAKALEAELGAGTKIDGYTRAQLG